MPRTGRRPGTAGTRERILDAARSAFAEAGFDGATIRGIARSAGVDPALVHHYFGSKEQLFVASIELPFDPSAFIAVLAAGGAEGAGERVIRFALGVWRDARARSVLAGVARSAASDDRAAEALRALFEETLLPALRSMDLDRPELRASLVWSQIVGLFFGRYVLQVGPLVDARTDEVIAAMGPALQAVISGPVGAEPFA